MSELRNAKGPLQALEQLVVQERYQDAAALVSKLHVGDAADALQDYSAPQVACVLLLLPREQAADILEELPDDLAAAALDQMRPKEAAEIVTELTSDEEADILQEVSEPQVERIIEHLDTEQAQMARELLAYDEDTAGGLMQKEFLAMPSGLAKGDVVARLSALGEEGEFYPFSYIYVTDDNGKLVGVLSLRALLFTGANTPVAEILDPEPLSVPPSMPGDELVKIFRRSHLLSVPVVDSHGKILGIVTQEDAMRFSKEESEEEFLRFSGIAGGEEVRDMPLRERAGKRLIWLVIKMFLNIIPASVIAYYTETAAFVMLAPILPIISDMGGSGGSQAIAVTIRELSVGRIKTMDAAWVLGKELGIGILNGLVLGFMLGAGAWFLTNNSTLAMVVGVAMLASTIVAVCVGGLMPIFLRMIKVDPAVASSPILTMVTDTCGFYFVLAMAVALYPHR